MLRECSDRARRTCARSEGDDRRRSSDVIQADATFNAYERDRSDVDVRRWWEGSGFDNPHDFDFLDPDGERFARNRKRSEARNICVGFVYVVATVDLEPTLYKVGFSEHPEKRVKGLATGCPFDIELLHSIAVSHRAFEQSLHLRLARYRVRGEWFQLPADVVATLRDITEISDPEDLPGCL